MSDIKNIEDKEYVVYMHTVPKEISGYDWDKHYVGVTSQKINNRWKKGLGYKNQSYFYKAILKYGWDNIKHEIIMDGLTANQAGKKERELITEYHSNDPKYGYNLTNGGDNILGDIIVSDSTRKKHSEASKLYWSIPGNKDKISGENCQFHKHPHVKWGKDNEMAKSIVLLNTGEVFDTIRKGAKMYNVDASHIGKCCKGKQRYSGKYKGEYLVWMFYDEYVNATDKEIKKRLDNSKHVYSNSAKQVLDVTNMIIYPTATKASKLIHGNINTLSQHIRENKLYLDRKWAYVKDFLIDNNLTIEELKSKCTLVK